MNEKQVEYYEIEESFEADAELDLFPLLVSIIEHVEEPRDFDPLKVLYDFDQPQ